MIGTPTLTIYFDPPDDSGRVGLKLLPPQTTELLTCSFALPFRLSQTPLVARALDARQYEDYPTRERFIRPNEDRTQIVRELKALDLWDGDEPTGAVAEDVHVRVGRLLGAALLASERAKDSLNKLYKAASDAGEGEIVLWFTSGASALAALPWEVAHKGSQPLLLAKGIVLNCTRVITPDHLSLPSRFLGERLCILTIAPRVQMDAASRAFEKLTRSRMHDELLNFPMVDIEPLQQATMDALYKRLDQGSPVQVLDYFGHGISTDEGGALLLENALGGRDPVTARRLAALPNLPPLIVLHACQSAWVNIDEPLTAVATALSDAGVRAVLAMQLTIRMEAVADMAAPTFYRKLAEHKSIQQAVAEMRRALYTREPDGVSWYVPTLYLGLSHQEPFVLLSPPAAPCPPNPFAGEGALGDPTRFMERAVVKSLWDRLNALGNLSIIGSAGSGKSTILALIAAEGGKRLKSKPQIISLPLQKKMKLVEAQLMLARILVRGVKVKATEWLILIRGKHLILLLDDLGQLDKGERGLEVRLWLRQLSQDRMHATVQLVATSMRRLDQIFEADESPDYSPLHNVMMDSIELGAFTVDEARQFIITALEGTPFQLQDFLDLLKKPLVPRALQAACRARYDELCERSC